MGASNSKSEDVKTVETTEDIPVEEKKVDEVDGVMETQVEIPKILANVINAPTVCEIGYKLDHEGKCRKIIF